jgi:hypothetical protein
MVVLYWCVLIRRCQGTASFQTVCQALPKDVRQAIKFFKELNTPDENGRSGIAKVWNHATMNERETIERKGKLAQSKLEKVDLFEQKADTKNKITETMQKILGAKEKLEDYRRTNKTDPGTVEALKENIAVFEEDKKVCAQALKELQENWKLLPKLTDEEITDILMYEYCSFRQTCLLEAKERAETASAEYEKERRRMTKLCLES